MLPYYTVYMEPGRLFRSAASPFREGRRAVGGLGGGGPGAGTGVDPRTWQRGTSTLPFNPPDDGFLEALAEAWANNDLAAGYAAADQPGAPRGGSFGSRTVRPAVPQPQSPWVKPTAHSGYGEILGHPIEGFRRRRGSIL